VYLPRSGDRKAKESQVLASRQKVEDKIIQTTAEMNERLPDLIVYDRIYKNAVLGKKIAAVYKGIVQFSRETAKYYGAKHGISKSHQRYSNKTSQINTE
jgi:hypothetical protein